MGRVVSISFIAAVLGVTLVLVGCEGMFEAVDADEQGAREVRYSVSGSFPSSGLTVSYMDKNSSTMTVDDVTSSWSQKEKMEAGSGVFLSVISGEEAVDVTLEVSVDGSTKGSRRLSSSGEQRITFLVE